jgi:hypothetical protein
MIRRGQVFLLMGCLLAFSGCDCRKEAPVAPTPVPAPTKAPVPPQEEAPPPVSADAPPVADAPVAESGFLTAPMRVLTLGGTPLKGMAPIATYNPNAFDTPIATGSLTDADGLSSIRFPASEKVALRAWDPDLRYFPNNFLEVLPNSGTIQETLEIRMVQAGILFAALILPNHQPVSGEEVGLMLIHPVYGPWWPAESVTNDRGEVVFDRIPPGKFLLRLKVSSGPSVEVGETYIAPAEPTALGQIQLQ